MRVEVVQGPNAGKTLDMSTRQAEAAISRGWAKPTADGTPAASPAEVDSSLVDSGRPESILGLPVHYVDFGDVPAEDGDR